MTGRLRITISGVTGQAKTAVFPIAQVLSSASSGRLLFGGPVDGVGTTGEETGERILRLHCALPWRQGHPSIRHRILATKFLPIGESRRDGIKDQHGAWLALPLFSSGWQFPHKLRENPDQRRSSLVLIGGIKDAEGVPNLPPVDER